MDPDGAPGNPHATDAENARFAAFAAELEREGLSRITRACYASDWWTLADQAFESTGRRFRLERFRADQFLLLRAKLAARDVSPATLNRRLAFLRRYTAFAAAREPALRALAAEFAAVPYQAVARRTTRALGHAQEERLRAAADALGPQEAAIVALILGTGLRGAEVAELRREDVLGPAEAPTALRIRGPRAKTVLLSRRTVERLAALLAARQGRGRDPLLATRDGGPLGEAGVADAVDRAARDAGVEATPRTLRHTFGVRYLSEHREDIEGLARALGHSGLDAARAYRAEAEADTRAPVASVHRWDALDEQEPARGTRRRAFRGARLAAERDLIAPGASSPPQSHPDGRIVFVLAGRVAVRAGAASVEAGAGEFVHVPAGVQHHVEAHGARPALVLSVRATARREAPAG